MVGGVGLVTCLTFAWFSAPDLALTQIAVEVVTLVLILLGLRWLPRRLEIDDARRRSLRARARRARDLVVAAAAGIGVAALAFAVLTRPSTGELAPFFLANACEQAGGRNVVNVMLVDFRGFDTLGEITVVGIVAITVYALLRRFRPAPESIAVHRSPRSARNAEQQALDAVHEPLPARATMRMPAVLVRLLLPMAGLVSVVLPAARPQRARRRLRRRPRDARPPSSRSTWWAARSGSSRACACIRSCGSGSGSLAAARRRHRRLVAVAAVPDAPRRSRSTCPLLGDVHLSTALLFDLGVYMLVVGATLLMLVALAHQSLRGPRKTVVPAAPDLDGDGLIRQAVAG